MRRLLVPLLAGLLLLAGCADLGSRATELRDQADDAAERTRFCLAVARALSAVDEGATGPAAVEAAEEVLAAAPDELRGDARVVAEHLRRAHEGDREALAEPAFREAASDLREDTRRLCDPTD